MFTVIVNTCAGYVLQSPPFEFYQLRACYAWAVLAVFHQLNANSDAHDETENKSSSQKQYILSYKSSQAS